MADTEVDPRRLDLGDPASPDFKLDNYPFYLIDRINHFYGLSMETILRKNRMERVQWQVLQLLRENNPSSISELAARGGIKLSTVSRTVERMRKSDMVSTARRTADRRITEVFLNPAGKQALDRIIRVASQQYRLAMSGHSKLDTRQLRDQLQRILANLETLPTA